jgi:RES domain-containing protein
VVYEPELLDYLQGLQALTWEGIIFRHMLNDYPPDRANTRGARWNPPGVAAIYASLARETALAEGQYRLNLEPFAPRVRRFVYRIKLRLTAVLELSSLEDLEPAGYSKEILTADDFSACQVVGGAVAWLEHDGLIIPSVRAEGKNIVIYPTAGFDFEFTVLDSEEIHPRDFLVQRPTLRPVQG